ncbi:MAG: phosphoketolase family protein, partial [Clostridia bacterium]|nr:phosphoketolase family protein [Clostridia bacterium]
SNPTILSRLSKKELKSLFEGYGYMPHFVEGSDPDKMHKLMAQEMDKCVEEMKVIRQNAKRKDATYMPFPMIILRTPKGWTCPEYVNGKKVEGTFRAHQVPMTVETEADLQILKTWLESYKPEELFDKNYKLKATYASISPKGEKRMCATPYANGGIMLKDLNLPNIDDYQIKFKGHGTVLKQDMMELGNYIRDMFVLNKKNKNYRIFSPDEALSNRLNHVFEKENRTFNAQRFDYDEFLAGDGRVMDSYLSEHVCEGLLEGYVLTGRHGMFDSYEAFIRVVDSMIAQHTKWLKMCEHIKWRKPISSLNLVLTSNLWQQDHNGFTHQDSGMLDHLAMKDADNTRIYLPPDANTLLSCYDHCAQTKNYINVIIASKHPSYQWLSMKDAKKHCAAGVGEWKWAGMNNTKKPDVVVACCGATQTIESLAAVTILKKYLPKLNVKFVNVVDPMKLVPEYAHPHGMKDAEYDKIFTKDKPIIFNFHGYPKVVHELTYKRTNQNLHVSGYVEEGTITTPFDMRVLNKTDRYNQVIKILKYIKLPSATKAKITALMQQRLAEHNVYIRKFGVDMPEVANWKWN